MNNSSLYLQMVILLISLDCYCPEIFENSVECNTQRC